MIILSELWSKSLDIFRVLRYCVSLIGGDTHERLYASAAPAVLSGACVHGCAGGDRTSPPGTAGAAPDGAGSAMKLASLYQRKGAEEREVNGNE